MISHLCFHLHQYHSKDINTIWKRISPINNKNRLTSFKTRETPINCTLTTNLNSNNSRINPNLTTTQTLKMAVAGIRNSNYKPITNK